MFETPDDILEHFGVKGMRWGVRKSRDTSDEASKSTGMSKKKKVAIVLGSAAVVSTIGIGAVYAKKHMGVKVSDISAASSVTKKFAETLAEEPLGIIHSSRGKARGYAFLRNGGLANPETEFINAGLDKADIGFFRRYGNQGEKIAARFADPDGRKDFAGRLIGHDVVLPKSMASGVNSADDVAKIAWPVIKHVFNPFYRSEEGTYGPGY